MNANKEDSVARGVLSFVFFIAMALALSYYLLYMLYNYERLTTQQNERLATQQEEKRLLIEQKRIAQERERMPEHERIALMRQSIPPSYSDARKRVRSSALYKRADHRPGEFFRTATVQEVRTVVIDGRMLYNYAPTFDNRIFLELAEKRPDPEFLRIFIAGGNIDSEIIKASLRDAARNPNPAVGEFLRRYIQEENDRWQRVQEGHARAARARQNRQSSGCDVMATRIGIGTLALCWAMFGLKGKKACQKELTSRVEGASNKRK